MSFANLKPWQWIVISLFVGAALSYSQLYDIGGKRLDPSESMAVTGGKLSADDLVLTLGREPTPKGYAWISGLTFYPPVGGQMFATGRRLEMLPNSRDKAVYKPFQVISDIPFKFRMNGPDAPSPTFTLKDFLDNIRNQDPTRAKNMQYGYAWWREPKAVWGLWGGGSVLFVGLLWPAVLSVVAPRRAVVTVEDKTAAWGKGRPEPTVSAKKGVSQEDLDSLDQMTARLEAGLKGSGHTHTAAAGEIQQELSAATIKKLNAAPIEPVVDPKADEGPKDYAGEFYPVVKTGEAKKH